MEGLTEALIALVALTSMEIVLGIDNIVFITILTSKLPVPQQPGARKFGLLAALGTRLLLLLCFTWILHLTTPIMKLDALGIPVSKVFRVEKLDESSSIPPTGSSEETAPHAGHAEVHDPYREANEITWKDIILFAGGLFLIRQSVKEIHNKIEGGHHEHASPKTISYSGVITQIALMDIIFSLDSVITAVGMVDPAHTWVIYTSVIIAVIIMVVFAEKVSHFVKENPTIKMLALSFLILIGVLLVAEGAGAGLDKGYIYFAMGFALIVEFLNMRMRKKENARLAVSG